MIIIVPDQEAVPRFRPRVAKAGLRGVIDRWAAGLVSGHQKIPSLLLKENSTLPDIFFLHNFLGKILYYVLYFQQCKLLKVVMQILQLLP